MANQLDAIQKIDKELQKLTDSLKAINKEILITSKNAREVSSAFNTVKTPKDLSNEIDKTNKSVEETVVLVKERNKQEQNLQRTLAKRQLAEEEVNKALIKERFELQQQNKLIKEAVVISSRYSTLLQKTTAQRNKLARVIQDLNVKRELGIKLTDKEQKELRQSTKEFQKYDKAVRKARRSVGRFQDNVGNYPQLLGSITSLTTGLIGSFGVIEGLRLSFDFAKEAAALAREAKGVEFAFKRLGSEGIEAFENIKKSTRGLLSDLDIKRSLNEFSNFNISLEQTDTLFEFLAVRASQTGRSIDSLKDSLVEGLSKESKLRIDNLGISAAKLNDELKKTPNFVEAVANIAKTEIAEAGNILDDTANSQEKFNAAFENFKVSAGSGFIGQLTNSFFDLGTSITELASDLNDSSNSFSDFFTNLGLLAQGQAGLVKARALSNREQEKRKELVEKIIPLLREQSIKNIEEAKIKGLVVNESLALAGAEYELNKRKRELLDTSSKELLILLKSLEPKKENNKIIKDTNKELEKRNKITALSIQLEKERIKDLKIADETIKSLLELYKSDESFELPEIDQASLNAFTEQINKAVFSDVLNQDVKDRLRNSVTDFFNNLETSFGLNSDVFDTFFDRITEKGEKSFEQLADIASSSFQVIGEVGNALFASSIQRYDDEIEANNEFYANLLENEQLNDEERKRLETDRKNEEKRLREEQKKEERKAFLFNQALAIAQIGIDLAKTISAINLAAAAQDAITPFAFGAVGAAYRASNIPLAIASAALQTGVVLTKALPAFAEGGVMPHDGLMMINDHKSGRLEVVERDGKLLMTDKKNAIVEGKRGDVIHKDAKEYFNNLSDKDIMQDVERHSMLATLQHQNYLISKFDNKKIIETDTLNANRIIKAIEKKKYRFNLNQNISLSEDLEFMQRRNNAL